MIINFFLGSQATRGTDNPEYPICIKINAKRVKRFRTTIGFSIAKDKWDKAKQQVKNKQCNADGFDAVRINSEIAKWKSHFLLEMDDRRTRYTKEDLRAAANMLKGKKVEPVSDKMELHYLFLRLKDVNPSWTKATITKYKTLANHIKAVCPKATINDFNEELFKGFVNRLIGLNFKNSYINKMCETFKGIINMAIERKLITDKIDTSALAPNLKTPPSAPISLNEEDLKKLMSFNSQIKVSPERKGLPDDWCFDNAKENPFWFTKNVANQSLERVRDVFVFGCLTGLRYSDIQNLKRSDVKDDRIEVVTQKTTDRLVIPLHPIAKTILDKYAKGKLSFDKALPTICNQKANEYLKALCERCGIDEMITIVEMRGKKRIEKTLPKFERITTHCARKTFITLSFSWDTAVPTVMSMTGHKNYNSMKPYIATADKSKREAINKFNNLNL